MRLGSYTRVGARGAEHCHKFCLAYPAAWLLDLCSTALQKVCQRRHSKCCFTHDGSAPFGFPAR